MTTTIEGIPEGWELVKIGLLHQGDRYIGNATGAVSTWTNTSRSNFAYAIVRKKEKTLAEKFDEWVKVNDIKVGSKVQITKVARAGDYPGRRMESAWDGDRRHCLNTVVEVVKLLDYCQCVNVKVSPLADRLQFPFEVCEPVKKVLKPWDMDTMPHRVKVCPKHDAGRVYWAHPASDQSALVGGSILQYNYILNHYVQVDGSPCGIEVEE